MELSPLKKYVVAIAASMLIGYAFGRWTTPTKIEIKKEVVTVEKKVLDTEELKRIESERNKKLRTITVEIKRPDGTIEKTTRHVESTTTNRTSNNQITIKEETQVETRTTESKVVENKKTGVTISAMSGIDVTNISVPLKPIYGGHVQKNVFGPIGVGAFGMSNGVCGFSLDLSF